MEPEPVNGALADMLKKLFFDQLASAKVDFKGFITDPDTKAGLALVAKSGKKHATAPFDLDDRGIDYALSLFDILADQYKNSGPLTVGATPDVVEGRHSQADVENELRKVGIDPITIGLLAMKILMMMPDLVAAIKKLLGK